MPPTLSMRMRVRTPVGAPSGGNFASGSPRIGLSSWFGCAALDDPRGSLDGEVGPHSFARPVERHNRHGHARIVADIADLLVFGEVCGDEFVSVRCRLQGDPDQAHLGAAVGIQGDQGGAGTLADELARGVIELREFFYRRPSRFIPLPASRSGGTPPRFISTTWQGDIRDQNF